MSETTTLTGPLIKMLRQAGVKTFRMQSGKVKVAGGWMYLCPNGTADILCFPRGQPVWVETKLQGKDQSEDQCRFQEDMEVLGHRYIVARTLDEGLAALQ